MTRDWYNLGAALLRCADLRSAVKYTLNLLAPMARKRQVEMEFTEPQTPVWVEIDSGQIQQVLTNLMINGIQAMPDGGRIQIRFASVTASSPDDPEANEGAYVRMDVEDEGTGISDEDLGRLFDPFFTTKDVGEGTGLGLSVAYGLAQEHGGWITVDSEVGKGSCFSVFLPVENEVCPGES